MECTLVKCIFWPGIQEIRKTSHYNSSHYVIEKQVDKTFPYMYIYVYVCSSLIKINEPRRLIFPLFKAFCTHQQQSITLLLCHITTHAACFALTTFLAFITAEVGRRRKYRRSNELINTLYTTHHYMKLCLCVGGDGDQ